MKNYIESLTKFASGIFKTKEVIIPLVGVEIPVTQPAPKAHKVQAEPKFTPGLRKFTPGERADRKRSNRQLRRKLIDRKGWF